MILDSIFTNQFTRYNVRFTVANGEEVTAYLYIPLVKEKRTRFPAMLALHQTEAIGKKSVDGQGTYYNLAYAKELAQRGYVVIAPDPNGYTKAGISQIILFVFGKDQTSSCPNAMVKKVHENAMAQRKSFPSSGRMQTPPM